MSALTRADLDRMVLEGAESRGENCEIEQGPLFLRSKCHPETPFIAAYLDGEVRLICVACGFDVMSFKVAADLSSPGRVE